MDYGIFEVLEGAEYVGLLHASAVFDTVFGLALRSVMTKILVPTVSWFHLFRQ